MKTGVVIPIGADRQENVNDCLDSLLNMSELPEVVVLVLDGHDQIPELPPTNVPVELVHMAKHQPGMEQPRNIGVRVITEKYEQCTHAWFVDSDIIVDHRALAFYKAVHAAVRELPSSPDPVMIGPYEWLPPGARDEDDDLHNDPRWAMFHERGKKLAVAELGVALGCFSGNLVWPIHEFVRVGGFHPQLHHGRCEDGELGLRAASHQIPMILVAEARAWHLHHEVNQQLAMERNARDVPLLNSWHPWVEGQGLVVTDQDGARFDFMCECGQQVNTLEMWRHLSEHQVSGLILPDGMA